jgi:glyoxylase-like metal-dependent hydrolase (beta-lactamase superfamily II)
MTEIRVISLPLPLRQGIVNCYLLEAARGFVLVDTGSSNSRARLASELAAAGCQPGNLELITITHGDFDHTGNAAYMRDRFDAPVAMHRHDMGMAEHGDMFSNRSSGNKLIGLLAPLLFGFSKSHRFVPDVLLQDGASLSEYGLDAQVIGLPGHSQGSIGILTTGGDLLCGDLLENVDAPSLGSIMDDLPAAQSSLEKLRSIEIRTIYPGHGRPFAMADLPTPEERR